MMSDLVSSFHQSDFPPKKIVKCADVQFLVCVDVNNLFNGHIEVQKLLLVVEIANILLFLPLMLNEVDYW